MEAALLGLFMISACVCTVLLEHPASPAHAVFPNAFTRRLLIGLAMGATAVALIYSPWGKRSGAHFNPSVTLAFLRLGKIEPSDAIAYIVAQCLGGIIGVEIVALAFGALAAHPAVAFAVTTPGAEGAGIAFLAELTISFGMMSVVLLMSNSRYGAYTGVACGTLVATYITFEAPLSGMSMNPARTLASATVSHVWTNVWIYLVAPTLGMLGATEIYIRVRGAQAVLCAKLHHANPLPCIFRCNYAALERI